MGSVDVNANSARGSERTDRRDRTAARRDGRAMADGDIRARVQQVAIRQQRFERYLAAELEVDPTGLDTMDLLVSTGPSTPTELARRLDVSTAAMTLVLNRLEVAGHIRRDRHPDDGRKLIVTAAHRSADQAHALVVPMIEKVEQLIESMSEDDQQTVVDFLDRLIAIYDSATHPNPVG